MELICKILPGFNHRLKIQEKVEIIKDIFEFPNKILYKILVPLDMDFETMIKILLEAIKEYKNDITEEEIESYSGCSSRTQLCMTDCPWPFPGAYISEGS